MTSNNYDNLKKFKDTTMGIVEMTDVYLVLAKRRSSLSKYVDRPFHGLIYKLSGISEYHIGEEIFELSPGEVIYLPKGCSYIVDTIENGDNYLINFDTVVDYGIEPFVIAMSDTQKCETLLARMVRKRSNCEARHATENLACLYTFMSMIQRQIRCMLVPDVTTDFCRKAEKYIAQNFTHSDLTVSEVAASVNVDPARLRSGFVELCGMTPKEYIIYLRIVKAKKLLVNSDSPIAKVSERLGFSNSSYFSRFFNERTGFYPTEYRDKFKF